MKDRSSHGSCSVESKDVVCVEMCMYESYMEICVSSVSQSKPWTAGLINTSRLYTRHTSDMIHDSISGSYTVYRTLSLRSLLPADYAPFRRRTPLSSASRGRLTEDRRERMRVQPAALHLLLRHFRMRGWQSRALRSPRTRAARCPRTDAPHSSICSVPPPVSEMSSAIRPLEARRPKK